MCNYSACMGDIDRIKRDVELRAYLFAVLMCDALIKHSHTWCTSAADCEYHILALADH